mgnify:CR=1 FL=1
MKVRYIVKYKVINLLNGAVTVIIAKNLYQASRRGKRYFSEPNRDKIPVQIVSN